MDSFKIVLTILLAIIVSRIQCVLHFPAELNSGANRVKSNSKSELYEYVHHTKENEKNNPKIQNMQKNIAILQMKKNIHTKTKNPSNYLIPPHEENYGVFNKLNVQTHHTLKGRLSRNQKQPIQSKLKAEISQEPIYLDSINQNMFVIKEQNNLEEVVLKKVPQFLSKMSSSTVGTSTLSDKDVDLLNLIAKIKLATLKEKIEIHPEEIEEHRIQIGFKVPMPLAASLSGSAGILKGHLSYGGKNERLLHEPIPYFGKNKHPSDFPLELATQIKLQSDSYGPIFNPSYKESYPGFLPVKLSPNSEYIEFPIEMYKTKFDPIPVSDNVYVNHQLGTGQKAGHIFPIKASKGVFGYTRSSRFIGNIIHH